ncbi:MAG: bifunctional diaminohydroxyphosphoribosylaminopyrimidine deaminase/5-amino-6-(5-phosphoribosylamino)uracil reductase RibD [Bacteroidetes bacterium]|nr:bifunctional diaminohydroxyphosphoribosylaminopyrimidine deaminase/5-amino-6-(5-phosphoribosylamino)uracil reductase RibD [Bacteroidota bacterium]
MAESSQSHHNSSVAEHEKFMRRSLELAVHGRGKTLSNPMVGCVIVWNNTIIGEGFHSRFGAPHAEVEAIRSVQNPKLLKESRLYVTLEPCSHFGKTPPCANLIIEKEIPEAIIAMRDPNPVVTGNGIQKLQEAGVRVTVGILEPEARNLNKSFIHFHETGKPYVVLKWARTLDGIMGRAKDDHGSRQISSEVSALFVHKLRSELMGIVVGSKTLQLDNPQLTNRLWPGSDPVKFYLGKSKSDRDDVIRMTSISELFAYCQNKNITGLLIEGGSETLQSFLQSGEWNEAFEIEAPVRWENGIKAPEMKRNNSEIFQLGNDLIRHYYN